MMIYYIEIQRAFKFSLEIENQNKSIIEVSKIIDDKQH